jgi:hypothetical protein
LIVRVTRRTAAWPRSEPRKRPSTVPTAAAAAVSTRTSPKIWPGVAPRERSVPKTTLRCSTLNITVLAMRNMPTTSASRLKAVRFSSKAAVSWLSVSACSLAGTRRTPGGSSFDTRSASRGLASRSMRVSRPERPNSR